MNMALYFESCALVTPWVLMFFALYHEWRYPPPTREGLE